MITLETIEAAATYLRSQTSQLPHIAVVLGSGLGGLIQSIKVEKEIPYSEIPFFPVSTVAGHQGKLILGTIEGKQMWVMQGRFHYYEGYSMQEVTFPIRVMQELGVDRLILSNAAGGLNPSYKVGDIILIKDHINLFPESPLRGKNDERLGARFPHMGDVYSARLREIVRGIASEISVDLREGVYLGTSGPAYETPAECRFYRMIGADTVGMSTVPEAMVAVHAGMQVVAFSVVTNMNDTEHFQETSHEEVQVEARKAEPVLKQIIQRLIKQL